MDMKPQMTELYAPQPPKVEAGEMVEGLEGLPAAEEQLALYESLEEAAKAEEEEEVAEDGDEELIFKDVEALKAHIFTLADNHMEQVVTLVRGWIKQDEAANA